VIANASFVNADTGPGTAVGWTLRSACAHEAIAPFAPGESVESFERWTTIASGLASASLAPFAPNGTIEMFDAWPNALFALELSAGLVAAVVTDGFEAGWWEGTAAFVWSSVAQVTGLFARGATSESFDGWQPGAAYIFAFPASALTDAAFTDGPIEMFTTWTTKNPTLG
jgi:hypothetical protein